MTRLFVGGFSHTNEGALHVLDYDQDSGRLTHLATETTVLNPAFLVLHPLQDILYAVSELSGGKHGPQPAGGVAALEIHPDSPHLGLLGMETVSGPRPCHVAVDPGGRMLFVASYRGASVSVFPLGANGELKPLAAQFLHEGSSVIAGRQECSHPHCCVPHPANGRVYVADLGIDKVMTYSIHPLKIEGSVAVRAGSGPRHLKFDAGGRFAYLTNEMSGTITVFTVNRENGTLAEIQTISTLPSGYDGLPWNSEIVIAPSGRFVYAGNRGHDSIAILAVDPASGRLTLEGHQATQGQTPRHFTLDPQGRRLLVGNQDSNSIAVFDIEEASGLLTTSGQYAGIPFPVCLLFDRP